MGAVLEFRDVTEEKKMEAERLSATLTAKHQEIRIREADSHKQRMTQFVDYVSRLCHAAAFLFFGKRAPDEIPLDALGSKTDRTFANSVASSTYRSLTNSAIPCTALRPTSNSCEIPCNSSSRPTPVRASTPLAIHFHPRSTWAVAPCHPARGRARLAVPVVALGLQGSPRAARSLMQ